MRIKAAAAHQLAIKRETPHVGIKSHVRINVVRFIIIIKFRLFIRFDVSVSCAGVDDIVQSFD
jgi:hypothetical protein